MKKKTAAWLATVLTALSIACLGYLGSALRPFFGTSSFIVDENVPRDALPAIHDMYTFLGMGRKRNLDLRAYIHMLGTPSRHKIKPIFAEIRDERTILVFDPNRDAAGIVIWLGGEWRAGPSGPGRFIGASEER